MCSVIILVKTFKLCDVVQYIIYFVKILLCNITLVVRYNTSITTSVCELFLWCSCTSPHTLVQILHLSLYDSCYSVLQILPLE